jgi:hypothetical protein
MVITLIELSCVLKPFSAPWRLGHRDHCVCSVRCAPGLFDAEESATVTVDKARTAFIHVVSDNLLSHQVGNPAAGKLKA